MATFDQSKGEIINRAGLTATEEKSVVAAVRRLCELVNEHTVLLAAMLKHMNVTPGDVLKHMQNEEIHIVEKKVGGLIS